MVEVSAVQAEDEPFLLITHSHPVKCAKCGAEMPSPGRIAIKTTEAARYYCDCVTEAEMEGIVTEWNNFMAMCALPEEDAN